MPGNKNAIQLAGEASMSFYNNGRLVTRTRRLLCGLFLDVSNSAPTAEETTLSRHK